MRFACYIVAALYLSLNLAWAQEASVPPQAVTPPPVTSPPPVSIPSSYKIKQVIPEQNLVVVETSNPTEKLSAGKVFLVTFPDERQCSLILEDIQGTLLTLDSSSCAQSQNITRVLPIEPSLVAGFSPKTKREEVVPEETFDLLDSAPLEKRHVGVSVYYSLANELNFRNAFVSTDSGSGMVDVTYKTDTSAGFGLTWANMKPHHWGVLGNFVYEPNRAINSVTVKGPGGTYSGDATGTKPKVSFLIIEGNAVYRWNSFYLPFGLNVSIPTLSDVQGNKVKVNGSVGFFVGGGFIISENSSLEMFVRCLSMKLEESDGTSSIDYDLGTMIGMGFGYKYWF